MIAGSRARLCAYPAAIAITPDSPSGIVVWPCELSPLAKTVPSEIRARLLSPPAEIALTQWEQDGTPSWPDALAPQPTIVPSDFRARLCPPPAAIATTCAVLALCRYVGTSI